MSRRQFAAYLLTAVVLLWAVDLLLNPKPVSTETAISVTVVMIIAVIVHPRRTP